MPLSLPPEDQWLQAIAFKVDLPSGGWEAKPTERLSNDEGRYAWRGVILRDGSKVGSFQRGLVIDRGSLEARHDSLYLPDKQDRRKGFGKAYVTYSREKYGPLGVSWIRVDANDEGRFFNAALPDMQWATVGPAKMLDAWMDDDIEEIGEPAFRLAAAAMGFGSAPTDDFVNAVRDAQSPTPNALAAHELGHLFFAGSPNWQGRWPVP